MSLPFSPDEERREMLGQLLVLRLRWLRYLECAYCVKRALEGAGFSEVRLSGRLHLRGGSPGWDMEAVADTGGGWVRAIVQVKRWHDPVPRRCVDEIRALATRNGMPLAVVVSTGGFAKAAEKAAAEPGTPVKLVGPEDLGRMLVDAGVGTAEETDIATGDAVPVFCEDRFAMLAETCDEIRRSGWPKRKGNP